MHRLGVAVVLVIVLAACATEPPPAPRTAQRSTKKSLVPGTIGALVAQTDKGVRVDAVAADGPAARAGLQVGDLIVRCRGEPVSTVRDFNTRVLATAPGDRLRFDVVRDAKPLRVDVDVMQLRTAMRP